MGMDISHLLRNARLKAGITQAELGRRVQITTSVVSAYEHGTREPKGAVLLEMLGAMGIDSLPLRRISSTSKSLARGQELQEVLELAAQFPARHAPTLPYPIFGKYR